jgi:hypothetical protein
LQSIAAEMFSRSAIVGLHGWKRAAVRTPGEGGHPEPSRKAPRYRRERIA